MDIDPTNIYSYLNVPKLNRNLSDNKFNFYLDALVDNIYEVGFETLIKNYNDKLSPIERDWKTLQKTSIDKNNISSTCTTGLNIIKRYMTHIYDVKNHKGKSITNLFTKENIRKALIVNRKTHSTPYVSEIIRQLGFIAGTSKVTMYRPLLTKRIIDYFEAKNVLDVCVGWGGRMLGCACKEDVMYTGIEPLSLTFSGLTKIVEDLNLKNVTLLNGCAEDLVSTLEPAYDLALTSPPYYNLEIYSDEESQSHHYNSYEEWVERFLKPTVYGVISKLKENGKSCWSVKNFKTDKKYNLYDDIVKLHEDKGWKKLDVEFYVGNCMRPGMTDCQGKAMKNKEVTYVFSKN